MCVHYEYVKNNKNASRKKEHILAMVIKKAHTDLTFFFIWKMHTRVVQMEIYRTHIESAKETIMMMLLCREWKFMKIEALSVDFIVDFWPFFVSSNILNFTFLPVCKKISNFLENKRHVNDIVSVCG